MTEINIDDLAPCPFCKESLLKEEIYDIYHKPTKKTYPFISHNCHKLCGEAVINVSGENWPKKEKK